MFLVNIHSLFFVINEKKLEKLRNEARKNIENSTVKKSIAFNSLFFVE